MAISRMHTVQSPIIPVVGELIRQNPGTISLGQGVVSYPPPPAAIEQIAAFLSQPDNHKYQAVQGIPSLLEVIAQKLQAENGMDLSDREIVVTAGSNMGFLNAVLAITQPGDEIILQTPYYFNHEMAIAIAGCRAVLVATDANYQLQLEAIEQAITERTRAIVTVSPNNPTGVVYPEADLRQVNQLCRDQGIYHIHDETYEYFIYDEAEHFSPGAIAGSAEYTISLYSLSKAYGFASWRIGYMAIPSQLLTAIMKIQDTNLICPAVISQYAAVGALQTGVDYCRSQIQAISEVRSLLLKHLEPIRERCAIPPAKGAFYFLLNLPSSMDALDLVKQLIQEYHVAAIPGTTFGLLNGCYLRVAYGALQKETASAGIERLVKGLQAILF
ncbi:pyridoxal phosphate-dependent aminotransferase [Pantanalinema sp. GBBB05]|uniref:pyridoxal phosphate-dependent aminotransferase n=1 Tax=Pantanalinema sp. GBBB05 TaxID=2604139 RepID=UPI001D390417|nr:pyridoxal phosphate-dependent aminotransferase [Pantanalinema sp. GBBB05]